MEKKLLRWDHVTAALLGSMLIFLSGFAQAAARNGRVLGASEQTTQAAQKDQLRQGAQATHTEIKALLTEILQAANKNQTPSEQTVKKAQLSLEKNKQNALAYDEKQRGDYMLLQAWTGYAQGNLPEAMSWSMRACKQDEASQDAWISQAVFSMLGGKRPPEPNIKKPKPETEQTRQRPERVRPQPRRNNEAMTAAAYKPEPYSTKGILEFDLLSVRPEFFREKFERLECTTAANEAFEYIPSRDMMCVFFWQSNNSSAAGDANEPGNLNAPMPSMETESMDQSVAGASLEEQRQYFTMLMKACKDTQTIKFIQVDTVRPKDVSSVDLGSYAKMAIPTLVAAHPDSNAARFACDASRPFMMIVDKNGSVKYSGPAAGFAPAFILTAITQKPISLEAATETNQTGHLMENPQGELMQMRLPTPKEPNTPVTDPNALRADPNKSQAAKPIVPRQTAASEYDFPTDDAEQQISAENLLRMGQLKIEESRKIRGASPEEGIKACRQVLEKYPNTPYADQARELLRRVPERYKEKFNITDEELGM